MGLQLLVVDDDVRMCNLLVRLFEDTYQVTVARDGLAALQLIERSASFDVILCDVHMPRMSGDELLAHLSNTSPALARRIVFLSGCVVHRSEIFQAVCLEAAITDRSNYREPAFIIC